MYKFSKLIRAGQYLVLCLIVGLSMPVAGAQTEANGKVPPLSKFSAKLSDCVRSFYPKASIDTQPRAIHFEFNTRKFFVHHALKTGEWQDAREEKGPNRGGILGDIQLQSGPYAGAACVPQTFDFRYYKVLVLAPDSKKHNCHLHARLFYPANAPAAFLSQYEQLIEGFEKYLH